MNTPLSEMSAEALLIEELSAPIDNIYRNEILRLIRLGKQFESIQSAGDVGRSIETILGRESVTSGSWSYHSVNVVLKEEKELASAYLRQSRELAELKEKVKGMVSMEAVITLVREQGCKNGSAFDSFGEQHITVSKLISDLQSIQDGQ